MVETTLTVFLCFDFILVTNEILLAYARTVCHRIIMKNFSRVMKKFFLNPGLDTLLFLVAIRFIGIKRIFQFWP